MRSAPISFAGFQKISGWLRFILAGIGFIVVFSLATWLAPRLSLPPEPWGLLITALLLVSTSGIWIYQVKFLPTGGPAGQIPSSRTALIVLPVMVFMAVINYLFVAILPVPWISTLLVILLACSLGLLMATYLFFDPDILFLICVLYILVDIYSVYLGPTGVLVAKGGVGLNLMTVQYPIFGSRVIQPVTGMADYAVWTACLLSAQRFNFNYTNSFWGLFLGLVGSALVSILSATAVPALPLMMAGYLIANRRHINLKRRDLWFAGFFALAVAIAAGTVVRFLIER
ncbi:MAG: hypothetical protein EXR62_02910 [Chloroflexi bacterium]|nr:hypothetical protein [Chloroflexota bacterium]